MNKSPLIEIMSDIHPFRSWRFDLAQVGDLSEVTAPPVELISEDDVQQLYKLHPCNIIRLIKNRDEPGDSANARFERANRYFRQWIQDGILIREHENTIYVYRQTLPTDADPIVVYGFVACLPIEEIDGVAQAEVDEVQRGFMNSTRANFHPLLATFDDPNDAIQHQLKSSTIGITSFQLQCDDGAVHELWPVTEHNAQQAIINLIRDQQLELVRGEQALSLAKQYRDDLKEAGTFEQEPASDRVMVFSIENLALEQNAPANVELADAIYAQCLSGLFINTFDV